MAHGNAFLLIVSQYSKAFEYYDLLTSTSIYIFFLHFFGVNGFEHIIFSFTEVGTRDGMNGRLGVMVPGTMAAGALGATWRSPTWELPTRQLQRFEVPGVFTPGVFWGGLELVNFYVAAYVVML